ncbi:coA-transferase III family protein [Mycobacterium xenopi 3993]|nr:coA-transferase III family protein [Mycobacterium xenopi 3993]
MSEALDGRPTPLDDLRVLEISDRIAGSYCGKLLVDAGAEVRKIEPPQGDPLRSFTASRSAVPETADAPLFSYLNAGKRSLRTSPDSERCRAELAAADIVVVTATRSQAAQLGINPQQLLADSPQVVVVTISDFGWAGPTPSAPQASSRCRPGLVRPVFAATLPDRPSRSAATWGNTWAARSPHSARWQCAAVSSAAVRVSTSTCPCSKRSR